jgi:hypothetical protein
MGRQTTSIRAIVKAVIWLLGSLLVLFIIWFATNRFLDEPRNPLVETFLASSQNSIPDNQNIAVGLLGLSAPAGSDFMQYGTKVKALYTNDAPWDRIQEMIRGAGTLQPTVESKQVNCWLDPDAEPWSGCLPFDQAPSVLAQNRELLDRYKTLYRLDDYAGWGLPNGNAYLVILQLSIAEMHIDLRQRKYEEAYQKWRQQFLFLRRILRSPDNWVGKAVGLVAIGMTLPFLEKLLIASPEVAKRHSAELLEILKAEGVEEFNLKGVVRIEFSSLTQYLAIPSSEGSAWRDATLDWLAYQTGQRNRMLNRYAAFSQEYLNALGLPWNEVGKELDRLRAKYIYSSSRDYLIDPFGSILIDRVINGQIRAGELVQQMHSIVGRKRLATLLVRLIGENVGDAGIDRFLATSGPELSDPFSGSPMRWDTKDRKIFFSDPNDRCSVRSYIRVPNLHQAGKSLQQQVNLKAC